MRKVLVYVDAENVTVDQFRDFLRKLESEVTEDEMVVGKFYGSSKVLGSIMHECYSAGFEFFDTSVMTNTKKNSADIKLAVDCVYDVVYVYSREVNSVYLVSNDHDFVPLAYKLSGQRIKVISPFLETAISQLTCADISKFLEKSGFDPVMDGVLLETPYCAIGKVLGESFGEELFCSYLERKRRKIAKWLMACGGAVSGAVNDIPITEFDFTSLCRVVNPDTAEERVKLFNVYTEKMYGICLTCEVAEGLLRGGVCSEIIS